MLSSMAASALEAVINKGLALALNQYQDDVVHQRLQALDGKVIAIDLQGMDHSFYMIFNAGSVHVQNHLLGQADVRIAGTPLSLLRTSLAGKQQQQQGLFSGAVSISGDVDLGRQFNALLDGLNIDWEELLSQRVGDVVAHELGSRARELGAWVQQSLTTLAGDTSEYLQEEAQLLASRAELEPFLTAVDTIRNDVERLEKRLSRLQHLLQGETQ